jgi:acyl-CoA dehydrogenase
MIIIRRVTQREAFGKFLAEQGTIQQDIALSRVEINQARLLCLNAAVAMDVEGNKKAKSNIAEIKIIAPRMAKTVIDRAMQSYGGMGLSQDTPLAHLWANARVLQLADGPDEVHIASLAKQELRLKAPTYRTRK